MKRLISAYFLFSVATLLTACIGSNKGNTLDKCTNCSIMDSLKKYNYTIAKKIDYFKLVPYSSNINCTDNESLFAMRKEKLGVTLLEFSCKGIFKKRFMDRYSDLFHIERQMEENKEAGEVNYITIYYATTKIVITILTEDTFSEEQKRFYLKDVFIVDGNFVTKYEESGSVCLNLKQSHMLLTEKQLLSLNENTVKELFFNKNTVRKYQYLNENFAENNTYISRFFLRFDANHYKPSDYFNR